MRVKKIKTYIVPSNAKKRRNSTADSSWNSRRTSMKFLYDFVISMGIKILSDSYYFRINSFVLSDHLARTPRRISRCHSPRYIRVRWVHEVRFFIQVKIIFCHYYWLFFNDIDSIYISKISRAPLIWIFLVNGRNSPQREVGISTAERRRQKRPL